MKSHLIAVRDWELYDVEILRVDNDVQVDKRILEELFVEQHMDFAFHFDEDNTGYMTVYNPTKYHYRSQS